jgi:hypothetical protein
MIVTEKYYPAKEVGKIFYQSWKTHKRPGNGKDDNRTFQLNKPYSAEKEMNKRQ